MYSVWMVMVGVLVVIVWLGVLTFFILRQRVFLKSLFPKSSERDIRKKFEEVIAAIENFKLDLGKLRKELEGIKVDGIGHIQKVGLLRFNPYEDTGGDQSFTIALLNKKGSGVVMTSLHARSGTRIFAKPVTLGKGKYELSKEEEEVLKKALSYD